VPTFILIHSTVWPQYNNVTNRQDMTDRQRSDSIGRTVLRTVAQKPNGVTQRTRLVMHSIKLSEYNGARFVGYAVTAIPVLLSQRPVLPLLYQLSVPITYHSQLNIFTSFWRLKRTVPETCEFTRVHFLCFAVSAETLKPASHRRTELN